MIEQDFDYQIRIDDLRGNDDIGLYIKYIEKVFGLKMGGMEVRKPDALKKNKKLEPYFLWFLKTNLMLPKVINLVLRMGNVNDINGLEIICNHERSSRALFAALEKHAPNIPTVPMSCVVAASVCCEQVLLVRRLRPNIPTQKMVYTPSPWAKNSYPFIAI